MDIDKLIQSEKDDEAEEDNFRIIDKKIEDHGSQEFPSKNSLTPNFMDSFPDLKFLNAISSQNTLKEFKAPHLQKHRPKTPKNRETPLKIKLKNQMKLSPPAKTTPKSISSNSPYSSNKPKGKNNQFFVIKAEQSSPKPQEYWKEEVNSQDKFIGSFRMKSGFKVTKGYLESQTTLRLYYTKIEPSSGENSANVVILHGFSHSARFFELGMRFAEAKCTVHMIDFSGFGYSGGPRGNSTIEELHQDLACLVSQINTRVPLFIYGHSLGGLVGLTFLIRNPSLHVSGVILSSPMLSFPSNRKYMWLKLLLFKFIGLQFDVFSPISSQINIL